MDANWHSFKDKVLSFSKNLIFATWWIKRWGSKLWRIITTCVSSIFIEMVSYVHPLRKEGDQKLNCQSYPLG